MSDLNVLFVAILLATSEGCGNTRASASLGGTTEDQPLVIQGWSDVDDDLVLNELVPKCFDTPTWLATNGKNPPSVRVEVRNRSPSPMNTSTLTGRLEAHLAARHGVRIVHAKEVGNGVNDAGAAEENGVPAGVPGDLEVLVSIGAEYQDTAEGFLKLYVVDLSVTVTTTGERQCMANIQIKKLATTLRGPRPH